MKRKTKIELRTHEWADFSAVLYGIEQRSGSLQSIRITRLIELLSVMETSKRTTLPELRKLLSTYQWTRTVEATADGLTVVTRPRIEGLSPDDVWEHQTAAQLLDLAMRPGGASRFRRCENEHCKTWFYASSRKDQRWCSNGGACRQYNYDNSEERKEARRASMRKAQKGYRQREAKKDAKAKRDIGYNETRLVKLRKLRKG